MAMVGIGADRYAAYPHELSGGMRQRLMIAIALACRPDVVIMDEPTTAVDVILQRQIVAQILEMQRALGFAIIFVTHDLTLLLEFADEIAIMYAGRIVELGSARSIYDRPRHPYTRGLRDSFPPLRGRKGTLTGIGGDPPDLNHPLPGCAFAPRCPRRQDDCVQQTPPLDAVEDGYCACWHRLLDDTPVVLHA
jgi:peptide/nickel transport system ATP-binding protein